MSKYGLPEEYTRFLRNEWLKDANTRIHHKAFLPIINHTKERLEVSCFETQKLSKEEIINITLENKINDGKSAGHATIHEEKFPFSKIKIDKDYTPERHVTLIDWKRYVEKQEIKNIAQELADISAREITLY